MYKGNLVPCMFYQSMKKVKIDKRQCSFSDILASINVGGNYALVKSYQFCSFAKCKQTVQVSTII